MSEISDPQNDGALEPTCDKEPERRAYEAPKLQSGDIFERIVSSSGAGPTAEECGE